jgi:hypothetical protein
MTPSTLTRIGWYAAGASIPATALLLALGGGHLNTFMFWFLLIGFTTTSTARLRVWWLTRNAETSPAEITATPIDWGVGSRLPDGGIRLLPISYGHPANCTHCKQQAPNIPAA